MSRFYVHNLTNQSLHIHQSENDSWMELPDKGFAVFECSNGNMLSGHCENGSFFIKVSPGIIKTYPFGKFEIKIKGYHDGESYAEITER